PPPPPPPPFSFTQFSLSFPFPVSPDRRHFAQHLLFNLFPFVGAPPTTKPLFYDIFLVFSPLDPSPISLIGIVFISCR
uniref:Uncharacterized protein n=1 Tax=Cucumis melo TaxID=3656 RepID=A0A9I9CCD4_CUCME